MSDDTNKVLEDDAPDADDELDEAVDEDIDEEIDEADVADEDEDGADEIDETEDEEDEEDELTPTPAASAGSGSSGMFWGGVLLIVIAVIAIWGWTALKDAQTKKALEQKALVQVAASNAAGIQKKITTALGDFLEADECDTQALMDTLGDATKQLTTQASTVQSIGTEEALTLGQQMGDLQNDLNTAIDEIAKAQAAYDEMIQAAQAEIKASAERDLESIAKRLGTAASAAMGDPETPVTMPSADDDDSSDEEDAEVDEADEGDVSDEADEDEAASDDDEEADE